jgi:hypothetical protein
MSIKVPASSTPAAAAAPAQVQKAEQATQTQSAQRAEPGLAAGVKNPMQDRLRQDGFEEMGKTRCFPLPPIGRPGETMTFGDRQNAAGLQDALSSPINRIRVAMGEKDETITRNKDGSYSGPNGEPLAEVKLNDGTTAYVDPNTNKYYLTDDKVNPFTGEVQATGPYDLPKGSEFSNSHFSEADVKAVQRHAASGSVFDFPKFPFPPKDPIELPKLPPIDFPKLPIDLPIDPIMLNAADLKDGGQ